jgi:predicted dehydrogenase
MRIGLAGVDSSHAEDFLRHFNSERRHRDIAVTAFWGGDEARSAELIALAPTLGAADSLDELIANVDAVIVGDRHGDLHLRHALPAIEAGKPVFVDKPLANSVSDATAMVDAAERAGVPLMSASALRWQAETVLLKARLAYVDGPFAIRGYGTWYPDNAYGGAIFYAIHTVEFLQELVGTEWSALRVEPGDEPVIRFEAGRAGVTMTLRQLGPGGSSAFGVGVTSPQLHCDKPIPLGDDYMAPVADRIAGMLRDSKGMDRETLLAPVRLMAEIEALLGGGKR